MCQDAFALQSLLQWQDSSKTFHVCFPNKPTVYFVKTQECFFFNPISISGLSFAKGNMIHVAEKEFWAEVKYSGRVSHSTQKNGELSVDVLEKGCYNSSTLVRWQLKLKKKNYPSHQIANNNINLVLKQP